MKTGIIGDVHANLQALESVLKALGEDGVDEIVCVGDVVGYGADPGACIELVRARCRVVVAGNHDHAAVKKVPPDHFNAAARAALTWTAQRLNDDERWWLSSLPLVHVEEAYSLVHSSFESPGAFGYIFNPEDAGPSFEKQETLLGFFGHTHWPATLIDGDPITHSLQTVVPIVPPATMLINVGSVGQPRDSNPQAGYVVLDHDEKRITFCRTEYDVKAAASRITEAGLPQTLAERLFMGY